MMNRYCFLIVLFVCATFSFAQKRKVAKARVAKPRTVAVTENPGIKIYKSMIPATAKIMFIDSVVVDKNDFLSSIPISKESGTLQTYHQFFNKRISVPSTVYTNEFGTRCYFADGDTTGTHLYSMDKVGNKWGTPTLLTELDNECKNENYPFLMTDGITLFFSAEGESSMGGRDIFMTLFDSDKGHFYNPDNYGLPFNSTANDYLLAIDEPDSLGWLVTDRRQPEGKVCVYTFVPTSSRQSFEQDNMTEEEIEKYSRILSIKDTWKFGNRAAAMVRLANLKERNKGKKTADTFDFIINDRVIYHHLSEFRSSTAKQLFQDLQKMEKDLALRSQRLDQQRLDFHQGNHQLRNSILKEEKDLEQLHIAIHNQEKQIRNTENLLITK